MEAHGKIRSTAHRAKALAVACGLGCLGEFQAPAQELIAPADPGLVRSHPRLLRLGPFDFNPSIALGATYDDNVALSGVSSQADLIWSITPSLAATAGESGAPQIILDYRPSALFFTEHPGYNAVDQYADLRATYPFSRLTLGVNQTYVQASGGVVDVGNRVARQIYTTLLTSKYELSPKTSFEIDGRQEISNYERLISSRDWLNNNWFNYQATPKIATSAGVGFGYLESQGNPTQTYEQFLVRGTYQAAEKLDIVVGAGEEMRQTKGSSEQSLSPIFNVAGNYTPAFGTKISLQARRQEQNSAAFAGQNYVSTGFLATVTHRMWERYLLTLSAGYDNLDYHSVTSNVNLNRSDNVYSLRAGVDVAFNAHLGAGISYYYRRDDSAAAFSFVNNQISVLFSLAY